DHDVPVITDAVTGANEADAHLVGVNVGRDWKIETTHDLRNAAEGDPDPKSGQPMKFVHGIEVGHVFKLGTKYSEALGATFLDEQGERKPIIMGCYGIGVNRIIAGLAETSHDEKGLIWPVAIAPYETVVVPLNMKDAAVREAAERLYQQLSDAGVDVLLDDRAERPGVKFNDADLIGFPVRVVIGGKGLTEGVAELKRRTADQPEKVPLDAVIN